MARKVKEAATEELPQIKGRVRRLSIKNFRAIGNAGVTVELDDIVVLVGPNNSGKSSILRAYEVIMLDGSKEGYLKLDDFPNARVEESRLPEIELETEVVEGEPGANWIRLDDGNAKPRARRSLGWIVH